MTKDERMVGSLDLREVIEGFTFLVLPLMNPIVMDDFK